MVKLAMQKIHLVQLCPLRQIVLSIILVLVNLRKHPIQFKDYADGTKSPKFLMHIGFKKKSVNK
jgi:hypothetical protein